MRKSIDVGSFFLSWGDELQQVDQAFYGVAFNFGPFCWAFFGLSVDRLGDPYYSERGSASKSSSQVDVLETAQGKPLIPSAKPY